VSRTLRGLGAREVVQGEAEGWVVPDEQHVVKAGGQLVNVERLAGEAPVDRHLDAERRACHLRGLQGPHLGARQARVDGGTERLQGAPGRFGLADPSVGQRALVIGNAIDRLSMAQEPEHALTVRVVKRLIEGHHTGRSDELG